MKMKSLTLSRVRFSVQWLMLIVLVYGGNWVGHYMADKVSGALPALSCAYNQDSAAYCVLIPTQHILHHRIGEAIVKAQQISLQIFLPLVFTLLSFLMFFVVLNKAFCGWICPLGTIQEWIGKIGRRMHLPLRRFNADSVGRVRPVKWLVLLALVFALPLLTGLGVTPHDLGNPYCDVCPSRLLSTLMTADTEQLAISTGGWRFALGAIANTLFGFMLISALATRQPFCRICPLLAFNSLFQRVAFLRLVKREHDRCDKCGICTKACPMDIHEIASEHGRKAFHEDCTLCGRCAEFCPDDDVIQLKWGPFRVFRSSRAYYKNRMKEEMPDSSWKAVKFYPRTSRNDET